MAVENDKSHRPVFFAVSASYFCLFLYYSFFARFQVLIYTAYGLDAKEIGTIGLLSIIASIPSSSFWGVVADRTGRRKLVLACCLFTAMAFQTLLCLAPYIADHGLRFAYCCFIMVTYTAARGNDYGQLRGIAMRALERFGRQNSYGNLRLWGAVSWGIAHPVLGWLLDLAHKNLTLLYVGNVLSGCLAVACFSKLLRSEWTDEGASASATQLPAVAGEASEATDAARADEAPQRASVWEVMRIVCGKPEMVAWLLCAATMALGMQHVFQFLFLFMEQRFHSTDVVMGLSVTVTVLFEVPIFAYSEWIVPKLGPTKLIAIAMIGFIVRVFGYTIVPSAGWIMVLEPLHGVTYSCFTLATVHYLNDHVPMHMISTAQGFMSSVSAVGSAAGALMGGWIMDRKDGGLLMFRIDTVIMSFVLVFFAGSQWAAKKRREPLLNTGSPQPA